MTAIFDVSARMERGLDFHMERQNLIASNIANVDTPGFAPRELERPEMSPFSDLMARAPLTVTDDRHMKGLEAEEGNGFEVTREYHVTPGNDRNYVSLEHEMSRLSANTVKYQAISRALSSHLGMLRYGASDARG